MAIFGIMYQVTVREKKYSVTCHQGKISVNGKTLVCDVVKLSNDRYHLIRDNKSYLVSVIERDISHKKWVIKINGIAYPVLLQDRLDQVVEKMGMNAHTSDKIKPLTAPMPGLILGLKVSPGESVKKGDPLLVLEAMKMENTLKSPHQGIIKEIMIKKGEKVEKGQRLVTFQTLENINKT